VYDIISNPKYVALAGVVMVGDRTVSDTVPTACTNGRDEMYGRAFVESLNDAELRFLILHEVYHKLYKHLTTWEWMYMKNANLANIACDHVINIKISDDNTDGWAVMPAQGHRDYKYRDWDAARVFKDLCENSSPEDGEWGPDPQAQQGGFDEHDWEGAQELTDDEKRELARDIDEAIRQGAMVAGKVGDGSERDRFGELLEPQINWREVLRDFIQNTCAGSDYSTWSRPNRRYVSSGLRYIRSVNRSRQNAYVCCTGTQPYVVTSHTMCTSLTTYPRRPSQSVVVAPASSVYPTTYVTTTSTRKPVWY
jgi:predicted metal-dependent peptidase